MNKPRQSHIIGKVYDITKENVNRLIKELDAYHQYADKLEAKLEVLRRYHGGDGTITRDDAIAALGLDYDQLIEKAVEKLEKKLEDK